MTQEADPKRSRAIVAAVQRPSVSDSEFEASLKDLRRPPKSLAFGVVRKFTQKRTGFDSAAYFGTGKREELRALCEQDGVNVVLIDHEISPSQAFNLAKEAGCEVMDRTMVILEIFHRHAASRFARAQVEIARLGYMGPRLREAAKQAGPKDRARSGTGGGRGGGGPRGGGGGRGGGGPRGGRAGQKTGARFAERGKDPASIPLEKNPQGPR